jgi:hypothetical protein
MPYFLDNSSTDGSLGCGCRMGRRCVTARWEPLAVYLGQLRLWRKNSRFTSGRTEARGIGLLPRYRSCSPSFSLGLVGVHMVQSGGCECAGMLLHLRRRRPNSSFLTILLVVVVRTLLYYDGHLSRSILLVCVMLCLKELTTALVANLSPLLSREGTACQLVDLQTRQMHLRRSLRQIHTALCIHTAC